MHLLFLLFLNKIPDSKAREYINLDCKKFNNNIEKDDKGIDIQLKYAMIDYYGFYEETTATKMTGALQWYWNLFYNANGFFKTYDLYINHTEVKLNGESKSELLWREYILERSINLYGGYAVSGVTVAINFIIRLVIVFLIKRIGIKTITNQTKVIMIYIFCTSIL